jgi:transposase-like protein
MATEGYAVEKPITNEVEVARFRQSIQERLRTRVREVLEVTIEEELTEALGSGRYERDEQRRGYRNGVEVN